MYQDPSFVAYTLIFFKKESSKKSRREKISNNNQLEAKKYVLYVFCDKQHVP